MNDINIIQDRIRQAAIDLQPSLRPRLSAKESRGMPKARKGGLVMVPVALDLIDRRPFLLADGRTPADVRKVQTTLNDLVILLQILGPLAEQVEDSIRQYQAELYVTVLNAYATACRVQGDAQVEIFAREMKKQLATGPRTPRMVTSTPVAVTVRIPMGPIATEE